MTRIRLTVIPEPEPRTCIVLNVDERGLQGDGSIDLLCGVCDRVLAGGLPSERLEKFRAAIIEEHLRRGGARVTGPAGADRPLVLRCPTCGAFNAVGA